MRIGFSPYLLLCAAISCSEGLDKFPGNTSGDLTIKLNVQETAVTRSGGQTSDVAVNDLNVFLYDGNGSLYYTMYSKTPGNEIQIKLDPDERYTLYMTANSGDLTKNGTILNENGMKELIWSLPESGNKPITENGCLPMSGMAVLEPGKYGSTVDFSLTRLVSKFRLIIDTTGLSGDVSCFKVTEVNIRNMNMRTGYFKTIEANSADDIAETGATVSGDELKEIYSDGIDIFITENIHGDLLSGNTDEKSHIPPSPFDRLCTYVEIKVDYRNREQYNDNLTYRYYLHDGHDLDNFDIHRNTMYTCRTVFTGTGINEDSWRIDASGMKDLVTSVTVSPKILDIIYHDRKYMLTADILPLSAENKNVVWASLNEHIAKVSPAGEVTPVGDGSTSVTATAADGSGVSDTAVVNVYIHSKDIAITNAQNVYYPYYSDPWTVEYETRPEGIPVLELELMEGTPGSATMENGVVHFHNPLGEQENIGRYKLKASIYDMSDSVIFNVSAGRIKIGNHMETIYGGSSVRLSLEDIHPENAAYAWKSMNPEIASISEDGTVTPLQTGECTIMAISETGARDQVTLLIKSPVSASIEGDNKIVNTSGINPEGGDWSSFNRTLRINLSNINDTDVTWEIKDAEGNITDELCISEDCTLSICSASANGEYRIRGWDSQRLFCTEEITVEVYNLVEFQLGLESYSKFMASFGGVGLGLRYSVYLTTMWTLDSWLSMTTSEQTMFQSDDAEIVAWHRMCDIYYNIGIYGEPCRYIVNFNPGLGVTDNGVLADLEGKMPCVLRCNPFDNVVEGNIGAYYIFENAPEDARSYFFVKLKNGQFFNREEYLLE